MKTRPLVLTPQTRKPIQRVIEYAHGHLKYLQDSLRVIAGECEPVGNDPNFTCVVPMGYCCTYSVEEQPAPAGWCRHLSVSVDGDGVAPNWFAIEALAREFEFQGKLGEVDYLFNEPIAVNKVAVNIIQRLDPKDGPPPDRVTLLRPPPQYQ